MKVLKRNEDVVPEVWRDRRLCGGCQSLLEVMEPDLARFSGNSPRGGKPWDYVGFQCPLCREWNTLDVPKHILKRVSVAGAQPPTPGVTSVKAP